MVDLIISLEATCDLPKEIIKQNDLRVVSMEYFLDGESFRTHEHDAVASNMYQRMLNGVKTGTTQINAYLYEEHFNELLKEGKPIFHVGFASGLSGSYNQALTAVERINGERGKKIYIIDSICGCSGQGLLAILVKEFAKTANTIEEVVEYAQSIKLNVAHTYTIDNFKYMAKSGRMKSTTAFIGNMLNIKPIMHLDKDGKLDLLKKVLSRKKAIKTLFEDFMADLDESYPYCIISHALCDAEAEGLAAVIEERTGIKPIITVLGPIIGAHSGPGTLSMYYMSTRSR